MIVELSYGKAGLRFELPDEADVTMIRKPRMSIVQDTRQAVDFALSHPVGLDSISSVVEPSSRVCIAICDVTRPVPNEIFLRPLIEMLCRLGVTTDRITVLIATGLHRPNEGEELRALIGDDWVLDNVRVVNHFARNDADHVFLGKTRKRGTVVRLDRRFVEADIRIATGLVEPHFMAGYSGGRKVIAPGLAHAETITTFHNARYMSDPLATNCNLSGNPLHEDQLEIVDLLGGAYALNVVIDDRRNLSFVNFGEIVASHQAAIDYARRYCEVAVPSRFPTVVTSAAGYPLDATYYQTIKGMVGAMGILEPGGDLVICSACSEGMGSADFISAQQELVRVGHRTFLASLMQKTHADIDEWQTQMQLKPMSVGAIHLFTEGLSEEEFRWTGVNRVTSPGPFLRAMLAAKSDRRVAVIPEGPYVVPSITLHSH